VRRAFPLLVSFTALLAAGGLLTACGESTVEPDGAEQSVVDVVSRKTGFRPTDVSCPSGVEAEVGGTFDCEFTGPEGRPYTAKMRIVKVEGERVVFQVNSRPSGGQPNAAGGSQ
jgi:uncharacterized protein DUF4333